MTYPHPEQSITEGARGLAQLHLLYQQPIRWRRVSDECQQSSCLTYTVARVWFNRGTPIERKTYEAYGSSKRIAWNTHADRAKAACEAHRTAKAHETLSKTPGTHPVSSRGEAQQMPPAAHACGPIHRGRGFMG